ncbi:hypothetical protein Tco_0937536 [Tanacetum coccineum]|uniref:Uncharacterized protein n=1 Tax=Tanacetum coccineum TaxID=301880 RepID=A0ABQ5DEI7_9ASTR
MGSKVQESKEKKEEGREETTNRSRKKMLGRKRAGKEQQKESLKKQKVEEEKDSEEWKFQRDIINDKDIQELSSEDLEALWRLVEGKVWWIQGDYLEVIESSGSSLCCIVSKMEEMFRGGDMSSHRSSWYWTYSSIRIHPSSSVTEWKWN